MIDIIVLKLDVPLDELAGPDGPEGSTGGIESRSAILAGIDAALGRIRAHPQIERILTIGGECSVSVAPFSHLAALYGEDLGGQVRPVGDGGQHARDRKSVV